MNRFLDNLKYSIFLTNFHPEGKNGLPIGHFYSEGTNLFSNTIKKFSFDLLVIATISILMVLSALFYNLIL